MTIWLMTLPEKFKEWRFSPMVFGHLDIEKTAVMALGAQPTFPIFDHGNNTCLSIHPCTKACKIPSRVLELDEYLLTFS